MNLFLNMERTSIVAVAACAALVITFGAGKVLGGFEEKNIEQ